MSYTVWDIETTTKPLFKQKASPFNSENWVVTHAFKRQGMQAPAETRFGSKRPPAGWFSPVLESTKLLVGFNIKFDVLHAIQDRTNLGLYVEWVANGGQLWDCQLAEYLLEGMGQKDHMLSLDEVAPRYGAQVKVDEVKVLWQAGVSTEDIDPELLSKYLVGDEDHLGDIGNTEKVFLGQLARAKAAGQVKSIMLNMGSLLCTIEMERNGMFVDKARGLEIAVTLGERIKGLAGAMQDSLPKDLPFSFNWGSVKQKSALIFGGEVTYPAKEYDLADGGTVLQSIYDAAQEKPRLKYAQIEITVPVQGEDGTPEVYKSGKNAGEIKTKKIKVDDITKPKGRTVQAPYTFPRMTKPNKEWAGAVPGVYSVSSEVIESLGGRGIKFLDDLVEYSKLTKDLGTYYISPEEEGKEQKGMLTMVGADGIVHHKINHTSTVTGRFSSSSPNLQNVPKGNKSEVKTLFKSRFDNGSIIQSDFSSLEIYCQANLTGSLQLIEDLKQGLDMHCLRLSNTEGMDYAEVVKLCKGPTAVKEWEYKRTDSKVYSFQAAYGAGDTKIAQTTGMDIERVAALRAADDARYPEIKEYFEQRTSEIKQGRRPYTVINHPNHPGLQCFIGESFVTTPDGKIYRYTEQPAPDFLVKKGTTCSFSPTEIKNYEVQGTGGEWAKAAMWLAIREFYRTNNYGGRALLVNQVHDALYVDAAPEVALEAAAMLDACMAEASAFMEYHFKWEIKVPVPTETKAGPSMMEEAPVEGMKELSTRLRKQIRDTYMKGYVPSFERT